MPGIDGDFRQFRHDTINTERLIPQLAGFDDLAGGGRHIALGAYIGQVFRGHIAALAVRASDLIPRTAGFLGQDDLSVLFVAFEDFVAGARPGSQAKCAALGGNLIDIRSGALGNQVDPRRGRGGNRCGQDAAFRQALPFTQLIQRVRELQFPFAVQSLGDGTVGWGQHAQTVSRKV